MTTERHQQSREKTVRSPSLRDYWNNPTQRIAGLQTEPGSRRARSQRVTTPSLWDASPPSQPADVLEPTAPPSSAHETLHLRERLQQRGVDTLSTTELLTLVLPTGSG